MSAGVSSIQLLAPTAVLLFTQAGQKQVRVYDVNLWICCRYIQLFFFLFSFLVHLCNVYDEVERHEVLPLCPAVQRFCIFSLAFSQDGNEVLGGANDGHLYVYDCEKRQRTLRVNSIIWLLALHTRLLSRSRL